jgi:dihydroorotate dehydrogenase (NAD+) catalytic subunit
LLRTNLAGIELRNPVVLAAGTCGVLDEMQSVLDLACVGAITTKSITPMPREGNETWRIIEARGGAGMLNAIGLANPGLDAFMSEHAPRAKTLACKVFASVAGFSIDDYVQVAANIDAFAGESGTHLGNIPAIELNVSCPNVRTGVEFGSSAQLVRELLAAVRPAVKHCKLFVKLGPMAPEFVHIARAAAECGADALTIANTIPAMAIDVHTRKPVLANVTGGLSGPAVHPVATRLIHLTQRELSSVSWGFDEQVTGLLAQVGPIVPARKPKFPIIGLGGVMNWQDAAEFILAGATCVAMGTSLFADPLSPKRVNAGLLKWVHEQRAASISELVGAVEV